MQLVTIRYYENVLLANVDKSKLESEGIEVCIQGELTSGFVNGVIGQFQEPIQLQVFEADSIKAQQILGITE